MEKVPADVYYQSFLSTLSLRRATQALSVTGSESQFLSTLSLRRATASIFVHLQNKYISIHALLAESDKNFSNVVFSTSDFYPRSPCGERLCGKAGALKGLQISIHALLAESDAYGRINDISRLIFLSTLSLRRATSQCRTLASGIYDFYPRSPCGERRGSQR